MTAALPPELKENRSDERETFALINALRKRTTAGVQRFQSGLVDLTTIGTYTITTGFAAQKFVPHTVDFVIVSLSGTHSTSAVVRVGTNATNDNIAPLFTITTAVVADELVGVTMAAPSLAVSGDIVGEVQTAATGAGLVLTGYFDITGYWQ